MMPFLSPKFSTDFLYSRSLQSKARDEQGSLTLFCLSLFVLLFVFAGMAVDLARLETKRVEFQNVLDSALFAVSVNTDESWNDMEIMDDFFVKSGFTRGGADNADWGVGSSKTASGSKEGGAWANRDSTNLFLNLYGFKTFQVQARSEVEQQYTDIEISLVIDVSGSMDGSRMDDLRTAVVDFAQDMFEVEDIRTHMTIIPFDYQTNAGRNLLTAFHAADRQSVDGVAMSIDDVYNMPAHCQRFNRGTYSSRTVENSDFNVPALTRELHFASYTPSMDDDGNPTMDLNDTGAYLDNGAQMIEPTLDVTMRAAGVWRDRWSQYDSGRTYGATKFNWKRDIFSDVETGYDTGGQENDLGQGYKDAACRWTTVADPTKVTSNGDNSILPFATNLEDVRAYMNALRPEGATAAETGLNWGVALLDPSMRNTVKNLVDGVKSSSGSRYLVQPNTIDAEFVGRPANYTDARTLKVLVHMSDGSNSNYQEVKNDFVKPGPVDPRPTSGVSAGSKGYLNGTNISNVYYDPLYQTYSVRYETKSGTRYFCANGRNHKMNAAGNTCNSNTKATAPMGGDRAIELTKRQVLERFTVPDAQELFFDGGRYSDIDLKTSDMLTGHEQDQSNANFLSLCNLTSKLADETDDRYLTYTIAFDADSSAEKTLKACVKDRPNRFNAPEEGELGDVFDEIVVSITKLRLKS